MIDFKLQYKLHLPITDTMKLIVITGITGQQGGSVADTFLADKSWHIRAITRDSSAPLHKNG